MYPVVLYVIVDLNPDCYSLLLSFAPSPGSKNFPFDIGSTPFNYILSIRILNLWCKISNENLIDNFVDLSGFPYLSFFNSQFLLLFLTFSLISDINFDTPYYCRKRKYFCSLFGRNKVSFDDRSCYLQLTKTMSVFSHSNFSSYIYP